MFLPKLDRMPDFLDGFARAHFPNKYAIAREKRNKFLKIDIPGKRRLMILGRPNAVLQVTTERARSDRAQPFGVIEESEILKSRFPRSRRMAAHDRSARVRLSLAGLHLAGPGSSAAVCRGYRF